MIEEVKRLVIELLDNDKTGHGMDHVERVYRLAIKFARDENADINIVSLASLLHDVDDYKLFGEDNANNLTNAKNIMNKVNVDEETKEKVLNIIKTMGYKKLLNGIRPSSIEGMVVSDADMCDTIGANGILRVAEYVKSHNRPFFDKNVYPIEDMEANKYNRDCADSGVCHFFEKILRLKPLMLTEAGKSEASSREGITIEFLKHIFIEDEAYEWVDYLEDFLSKI